MHKCHPPGSENIERSRKDRFLLAPLLLLTLSIASCGGQGGEAVAREAAVSTGSDAIPVVPVTKVTRAELSNDLSLTGEFQPYQEVDLMAKVSGYLQSIRVDIGDQVREGETLATLEIPEMEDDMTRAIAAVQAADADVTTAQDDLKRATASHEIAHLSYTRIEDVNKKEAGLVPKQDIDVVHSRDLESEAQLAMAQSRLRSAEQHSQMAISEQARVKTLGKYTQIVAPFSGVITKRYANKGSMIQAGTSSQTQAMPVVRLSQNNLLRLMLPVPEAYVGIIHNGEPVSVTIPALGRTLPGKVTRFADRVQASTRTMTAEVDLKNTTLDLIPGMYAQVQLSLADAPNAIAVPVGALDSIGNVNKVYTVDAAGTVHIRTVTTGIQSPQFVQVISGIQAGEAVVIGSHSGLQDGERVQPHFE